MHSWNAFKDSLVGSCVEVVILGMSSSLNGSRAKISDAFMVFRLKRHCGCQFKGGTVASLCCRGNDAGKI